jgi:gamma-glutamyltranspeptidase/glutathione hydrolase
MGTITPGDDAASTYRSEQESHMTPPPRFGIPPAGYRLPDTTHVGRVRLQVADLSTSLAWYQQVLGFRVLDRQGGMARLAAHDDPTPLIELHERRGAAPSAGRLGLFHFAILLPDRAALGRLITHLAKIGARAGSSNHLVSESLYLHDPDGLGIEVYADRPRESWKAEGQELAMAVLPLDTAAVARAGGGGAWAGMPPGTTIGHMHLNVGDLDRAAAFYHHGLGLDKMVWSYPGALFLAAGGYHHHLGTNTWTGPGATPPAEEDARLLEWEIVVPEAEDAERAATSLEQAGFTVTRAAGGWLAADPWRTMLRCVTAVLPLTVVLCMPSDASAQTPRPSTLAGRSAVYAPHGVIATSQPLASAAGLAVLQGGGNAFDAAVTAAAVLNLVEPHMTGIGGDMFAILWSAKEHRLVGLNASGRAGSGMTRDALLARGLTAVPSDGAEPITVPGALSGWAALLKRYGTISLAQALKPAIRLAEEGFPVSPIIARQWADEADRLGRDAGARATFLIDGNRAPREGEWFRNPDLARSLRAIADHGPEELYGGGLGQRIVDRVKELGGFLTIDDLRRQRADWVDPISVPFRGYRVWELPPNNQGVAVLEMLRILEPEDLVSLGHNSAPYLHRLIEAKKLAFADLAQFVGDPTAMTLQVRELLTDRFIAERRTRLDAGHAAERQEPGPPRTASETIYLTVADAQGNMVSFINSLFEAFGSGVVVPGTGFALQDRGAGFTLEPGMPNTVAPGRRPFHTLIPGFVTRPTPNGEEPWMSFGVMGGSMQPQGHLQLLLNLLVFGMDVQQAIDAPRFRHLTGLRVALEAPIPDSVRTALAALGHRVEDLPPGGAGGAQVIIRLAKGWVAGSDPRKDGEAAGY